MKSKTKIAIDYTRCGDGTERDPRECRVCLSVCEPAVFLLHQTEGGGELNPYDPQKWRITAVYLSLCTRCMKCTEKCPEQAIKIK